MSDDNTIRGDANEKPAGDLPAKSSSVPTDALIIVPVRDAVVFPGTVFPIALGANGEIATVWTDDGRIIVHDVLGKDTGELSGRDRFGIADVNRALQEEADKTGRLLSTYLSYMVILGETDRDAQRKVDLYNSGLDYEAVAFMQSQAALDTRSTGTSVGRRSARTCPASWAR